MDSANMNKEWMVWMVTSFRFYLFIYLFIEQLMNQSNLRKILMRSFSLMTSLED